MCTIVRTCRKMGAWIQKLQCAVSLGQYLKADSIESVEMTFILDLVAIDYGIPWKFACLLLSGPDANPPAYLRHSREKQCEGTSGAVQLGRLSDY